MKKSPIEEDDENFELETNALTAVFNDKFYIRLAQFIEKTGLSYNMFGKKIGSSGAQVSYMIVSKKNFGIRMLLKIFNEFPELNSEWLLRGSGKMILFEEISTPKSTSKSTSNEEIPVVNEPATSYHRVPSVVTIDKSGDDNIVLVEAKAAASYLKHYLEPHFFKKLPTFSVPGLRNGIFRGFQVKGNSMEPNFKHQDFVVGQFVDNYKNMREGYVHIVVTKEDIVLKRCLNRVEKRGKFVLISDNEDYASYEVDAQDVLELWDFKCLLTFNVPSRRHDFTRLISNLQADILELRDRLFKLDGKK